MFTFSVLGHLLIRNLVMFNKTGSEQAFSRKMHKSTENV